MSSTAWQRLPGRRHQLAEEPTLDAGRERLVWVDVPRGEIWARPLMDEATTASLVRRIAAPVSAARPLDCDLVIASQMDVLVLGDTGQQLLTRILREPRRWQVNGMVVRADGSLLAGLLSRDRTEPGELVLVRDGEMSTVASGVQAPNGLCLDDSGQGAWHVDSGARTLTRFTATHDGRLHGSVVSNFAGLPGVPDGVCPDPTGGVWVAMWDGGVVVRIDPAGRFTAGMKTPVTRPTCPLLAGERLYVTTARSAHRDDAVAGGYLYYTTLTHWE